MKQLSVFIAITVSLLFLRIPFAGGNVSFGGAPQEHYFKVLSQDVSGIKIVYENKNSSAAHLFNSCAVAIPLGAEPVIRIISAEGFEHTPDRDLIHISSAMKIRGMDYVLLSIDQESLNSGQSFKRIRFDVDFVGGNGRFGEERLRSRHWEPVLEKLFLNYESLPKVDFFSSLNSIEDVEDVEYLIIVPDDPDFLAWADSIKNWRVRQGITTGIVTISEIGGNTVPLITDYIANAYNMWNIPPCAVLLLSDYQNSGETYGITSPVYQYYTESAVSDNLYADVDGDYLPDIAITRITAQNNSQLTVMVSKFLEYERTPPTEQHYYDHPVTSGGWSNSSWAILMADVFYGFQEGVLGKSPVREYAIFSGSPDTLWSTAPGTEYLVLAFGPEGLGYIPATPEHLTDWGGNHTRINNDINAGAYMVLHTGPGSSEGWLSPVYNINHLAGLTGDLYPFMISLGNSSGQFDNANPCFTEAIHRHSHGVAGMISSSGVLLSQAPEVYLIGFLDYLWPEFIPMGGERDLIVSTELNPCFANVSAKYYLAVSTFIQNPRAKEVTYNLFHHHGDAFVNLYTEPPQTLTVDHPDTMLENQASFTVTTEEGAVVCLTVDNEIIGAAQSTGVPLTIPILPQPAGNTVIVTITKPNYFRYEAEVLVVPAGGPPMQWTENSISTSFEQSNSVVCADLDGDSDMDVIAASFNGDRISWWRNDGNQNFTHYDIQTMLPQVNEIYPADMDGDGDLDVCAVTPMGDNIIWMENDNLNFSMHVIDDDFDGSYSIFVVDIDFDGDRDVIAPSVFEDLVCWWENAGGGSFNRHDVGQLDGALKAVAADVDDDGDIDVICTSEDAGYVVWFENDGSMNFTSHFIDENFAGARGLFADDLDSDGDLDVIATSSSENIIAWWSNDGNQNFTRNIITSGFLGAFSVAVSDLDSDGDKDIVGAARDADDIRWWQNDGNGNFTGYVIDEDFENAACVTTFDIDLDGDEDVLGAGCRVLSWWRSDLNPDVGISMIPHCYPTTINPGGRFEFDAVLVNNTAARQRTDVWVGLRLPDGSAYGPVFRQDNIMLPPGREVVVPGMIQEVPAIAPAGGYDYIAISGDLPGDIREWSSLRFYVSSRPPGGDAGGWKLCGEWGNLPDENGVEELPRKFALSDPYPNPFNPVTGIGFSLPVESNVEISVYNLIGQKVSTLVDGKLAAGEHIVRWDAAGFASGIYFVKMAADDFVTAKRMTLLK